MASRVLARGNARSGPGPVPVLVLALQLLLLSGCSRQRQEASPLRVAAASDLQRAFDELGRAYTRQTGRQVVFSFGSSGLLARQIGEGAPFDLLASASGDYVDRLAAQGRIAPGTRLVYGQGRLVLWTRQEGPRLDSLAALAAHLAEPGQVRRVAVANPEHAPYGRAALEALDRAGLKDALKGRLVFAENVRQALQYAETGNADAALVALSLVQNRDGPARGRYVLIEERLHQPIEQVLGVISGQNEAGARDFVALLRAPQGQAILRRYGFLP